MLMGVVDTEIELILNSLQLAFFAILLGFAIYKMIKAHHNQRPFLPIFYGFVASISLIELILQSYQVYQLSHSTQPQITIFMIINLYAMTAEAATIFRLSAYWLQTEEIITKQSTEMEIKEQRHWARPLVFILWLLCFTAFVIFGQITNKFTDNNNKIFKQILALGCQGIGVVFVASAVALQVIRGRKLSSAMGRYEQWLNSISFRKAQFRLLYWASSFCNIGRLLFLIAVTIAMEFELGVAGWEWLAAYIYTFTNCIVILIYLLGFSTGQSAQESNKKSTLLDGPHEEENRSNRSRNETELSSSVSNRTN